MWGTVSQYNGHNGLTTIHDHRRTGPPVVNLRLITHIKQFFLLSLWNFSTVHLLVVRVTRINCQKCRLHLVQPLRLQRSCQALCPSRRKQFSVCHLKNLSKLFWSPPQNPSNRRPHPLSLLLLLLPLFRCKKRSRQRLRHLKLLLMKIWCLALTLRMVCGA